MKAQLGLDAGAIGVVQSARHEFGDCGEIGRLADIDIESEISFGIVRGEAEPSERSNRAGRQIGGSRLARRVDEEARCCFAKQFSLRGKTTLRVILWVRRHINNQIRVREFCWIAGSGKPRRKTAGSPSILYTTIRRRRTPIASSRRSWQSSRRPMRLSRSIPRN